MLPHEKLDVYRKALAFVGDASNSAARWDKRHAVADQFGRASDSLVLNLAEGARLRPGRAKLRTLDYALGVRWMAGLPGAANLPTGSHRQIDEGATSLLLNLAEGNGRY